MTVAQLIKALSILPDDTPVYVQGYEDGFSEIEIRHGQIMLNQNRKSWEGPHAEIANGGTLAALILRRDNELAED